VVIGAAPGCTDSNGGLRGRRGAAWHGDYVTKSTPRSAQETVTALVASIEAAGMRLFAAIDQQAEARQVGLQLRQTTLVRFASPLAGTRSQPTSRRRSRGSMPSPTD